MGKDFKKGGSTPKEQNNSKQQQAGKVQKPQALEINESNKYVLGGYFSLGLTNFFKTVLLVFNKAGIKVVSDNGKIIYRGEKIGQVLNTLYKSTLNPRPSFSHPWSCHGR